MHIMEPLTSKTNPELNRTTTYHRYIQQQSHYHRLTPCWRRYQVSTINRNNHSTTPFTSTPHNHSRPQTTMASQGNNLDSWEPSPWSAAQPANADQKDLAPAQAQAARAKSAEIMAALKKGEPGDADKLLVSFCFARLEDGWVGGWVF